MQNIPTPVAHTGAAVSIGTTILTFATQTEPVVSLVCACVGIVSGIFAIAYYLKGLRKP